ncbi:hypothetical protein GCM10009837_44930 [Streptomyces durmitorensis]
MRAARWSGLSAGGHEGWWAHMVYLRVGVANLVRGPVFSRFLLVWVKTPQKPSTHRSERLLVTSGGEETGPEVRQECGT